MIPVDRAWPGGVGGAGGGGGEEGGGEVRGEGVLELGRDKGLAGRCHQAILGFLKLLWCVCVGGGGGGGGGLKSKLNKFSPGLPLLSL